MYRRNIAAAAAVLFLSSAVGISAYAAPQKDNSATEAETETETETETQTETETETETQETEAATEREAGFVSIEEMPFEIETETETESSDQTETETETEQKIESPKVEQTFRFFQVEKKYAVSKRDDVYLYEKKNTKSDKVGKIKCTWRIAYSGRRRRWRMVLCRIRKSQRLHKSKICMGRRKSGTLCKA